MEPQFRRAVGLTLEHRSGYAGQNPQAWSVADKERLLAIDSPFEIEGRCAGLNREILIALLTTLVLTLQPLAAIASPMELHDTYYVPARPQPLHGPLN